MGTQIKDMKTEWGYGTKRIENIHLTHGSRAHFVYLIMCFGKKQICLTYDWMMIVSKILSLPIIDQS